MSFDVAAALILGAAIGGYVMDTYATCPLTTPPPNGEGVGP